MKLLRPFTSTAAIFFPIGRPPKGTCAFSTKECEEYCYAKNYSHFDFETAIPEKEKWEIYKFIKNESIEKIVKKIQHDLDGLQTPILHWFGTGDCMDSDLTKISMVIDAIPKYIIQMGFTRNEKLWEKYKNIFAFTIEDLKWAEGKEGMFSKPNYIEGISQMYSSQYYVRGGYCGPYTCRDLIESDIEHFVNCQVCMKLKIGCFDKR